MNAKDKIEAAAKNVEGKLQSAYGEMTGNTEDKIKGEAKQTQAKIQQSVEKAKDKAKDTLDAL